MTDFRTRLGTEIIVFDGGVGTYLYEKGIFINTCFDELNLTNPDIVAEVHRDYVHAGADVVETNTFGANQFKLAPHGLEKKVYEINRRGAEIAKAATKDRALVAGSVGPLGVPLEPLSALSYDEAKDAFKQQVQGLVDGGVDLLVLETFGLAKELEQAIRAVKEVAPGAPILAQFTVTTKDTHADPRSSAVTRSRMRSYIGPAADRAAVDARSAGAPEDADGLPLLQPNAGVPQNVGGRYIMTSPEYIASTPKRIIQTGASSRRAAAPTLAHPCIRRAVQALQPSDADVHVATWRCRHRVRQVYDRRNRARDQAARGEFAARRAGVAPGVSPRRDRERPPAASLHRRHQHPRQPAASANGWRWPCHPPRIGTVVLHYACAIGT
jgi:homocysteine S-methyltransferase